MPTALLSVTDKTGLVEFARGLIRLGWSVVASGGTAAHLREHQIVAREVSELTGAPEILGGRVKTLHPAVHGGILSRRTASDQAQLRQFGWDSIDLVAVNLYRFAEAAQKPEASQEQILEQIDIGGVALLRAAAKSFQHVLVLCHPEDYPRVLQQLESDGVDETLRRQLAARAFTETARYDHEIASFLGEHPAPPASHLVQKLRYGENPHQQARLYAHNARSGPLGAQVLRGKELSYNNLLDLDAAIRAVQGFPDPAVVVVKHLSPCGMACGGSLAAAARAAIDTDPVSAFGGIMAANGQVDEAFVAELGDLFLECLAARDFTAGALQALQPRKNLRLLQTQALPPEKGEYRSVRGGMLWQERDHGQVEESEWKIVTTRSPSQEELEGLRFAWRCCQHVRSNAIVLARGRTTVGIGGGQPNRVDSVRIAVQRAGPRSQGAVLASDAFFPFADSVELASQAGVTAIIQPGGSVRDQDSIDLANQREMAMILTGRRHFRH